MLRQGCGLGGPLRILKVDMPQPLGSRTRGKELPAGQVRDAARANRSVRRAGGHRAAVSADHVGCICARLLCPFSLIAPWPMWR